MKKNRNLKGKNAKKQYSKRGMNHFDWWFLAMVSLLYVLVVMDMAFTNLGLDLGVGEGNPLFIYLFAKIGIRATFISAIAVITLVLVILVLIRQKLQKEYLIRMYYFGVCFLMVARAFIVGSWLGIIATLTGGLG